jgi:hypothetical protein
MLCSVFYFFSFFPLLRTRSFSIYSARFDRFQTKLCETKPNLEMPKINITNFVTSSYSNNSQLSPAQKQTHTNPIQSQFCVYQTQSKPNLFSPFDQLRVEAAEEI